jgi:hypothetical protein
LPAPDVWDKEWQETSQRTTQLLVFLVARRSAQAVPVNPEAPGVGFGNC